MHQAIIFVSIMPIYRSVGMIIQMKDLMEQGNDIVWAQRESTKSSWGEKMFSKFLCPPDAKIRV